MNSHTIAVLVENIVVESHSIFSFSRNTDIFPRFLAVCGEKILWATRAGEKHANAMRGFSALSKLLLSSFKQNLFIINND